MWSHVQLQLNRLSLQHLSSSVITPRCLKGLLLEIQNHLPVYLKLPHDPKGYIWNTCTKVLNKGRFFGNCFNSSVGQYTHLCNF